VHGVADIELNRLYPTSFDVDFAVHTVGGGAETIPWAFLAMRGELVLAA
jgi:hypothetical protein